MSGFTDISNRDLVPITVVSVLEGFRGGLKPDLWKAFLGKSAPTHKCINCRTHIQICPRCKAVLFAELGVTVCNKCGNKFL